MSKISVNNAWFYSFHGCLHEESVIGGEYIVSAVVETDTSLADQNDLLESTVDYVAIYNVLKKHEPNHILLQVARDDAYRGLIDLDRLSNFLKRIKNKIIFRRFQHVSCS